MWVVSKEISSSTTVILFKYWSITFTVHITLYNNNNNISVLKLHLTAQRKVYNYISTDKALIYLYHISMHSTINISIEQHYNLYCIADTKSNYLILPWKYLNYPVLHQYWPRRVFLHFAYTSDNIFGYPISYFQYHNIQTLKNMVCPLSTCPVCLSIRPT
jgi:hypothetical protein